jgi:ABC-type sulfate transport system permease subunit
MSKMKQVLPDKKVFQKPLGLWPGIVIARILVLIRYVIPEIVPCYLIPGL